jgi:hypothetical protein
MGELDHRPASGHETELVVVGTRLPIGDERRQGEWEVDPRPARLHQPVEHLGELVLEDLAVPRKEVVRLPELGDSVSLPTLPRLRDGVGNLAGIALKYRHVMPVARQHHR